MPGRAQARLPANVPYRPAQSRRFVEAYFATVEAPAKRLVIIDGAGHFALATHQTDVIAALRQIAR